MKTYLQRVKAAQWNGTTGAEAEEFCEKVGVLFENFDPRDSSILISTTSTAYKTVLPYSYVVNGDVYYPEHFPADDFTPAEITRSEIEYKSRDIYVSVDREEDCTSWSSGFNAAIEYLTKKYGIEIKENE